MENIFKTLSANPNLVLATVDNQGKPHTRIIQYLFEIEVKFIFVQTIQRKCQYK